MIEVNKNKCEIEGTAVEIAEDIGKIFIALEKGKLLTDKETNILFKLTSKIIIKNMLKGE